ncbi:MAG: FAD-binding oxidoreductase [Cytophagaceae bacterium]|nr:FAD-binding oxidoreductase [Cytophagaceae bacterium]
MDVDFLILGQGLAGSLLADALLQRGQRVRIVADARPSSSAVAAGLFNPVTGRRPKKTWLADELFPFLHDYYPALEQRLGTHFFHPAPLYRPFGSIEEQNAGLALTEAPDLHEFLRVSTDDAAYAPSVRNELGGLMAQQAGWVDVPAMLLSFRRQFLALDILQEIPFDFNELKISENRVAWRSHRAAKLVCCEGVYATGNPYFRWLPFAPAKGETITVRLGGESVAGAVPPGIVNRGVWLIPRPDGLCRVGATYSWDPLDWEASETGRTFLVEKLNTWLKSPYELVEQQAGVRPAVQGRRPLIGLHPEFACLGIFNGLGSKGVSLAPLFAQQFAEFLVHGKELDSAVNISRFFSLYSGVD